MITRAVHDNAESWIVEGFNYDGKKVGVEVVATTNEEARRTARELYGIERVSGVWRCADLNKFPHVELLKERAIMGNETNPMSNDTIIQVSAGVWARAVADGIIGPVALVAGMVTLARGDAAGVGFIAGGLVYLVAVGVLRSPSLRVVLRCLAVLILLGTAFAAGVDRITAARDADHAAQVEADRADRELQERINRALGR